ncbi:NYN domain-containing protein [Candidatus Saccharibacteria bacterium]|nr:NYN domain-containing protein [Candidatus Saccharibacteria bacterium]MBI3337898.1 NYN domain-containing protein [Candidatus Saccharibacteria bacterium]
MTKGKNYAFIDSQNLNLGVRSLGWRLDYKKLRLYLKNKHDIEKAFMFIGLVANNQKLYTQLQSAGFILIFKPTVRYFENGKETVKGNVDAELVLHAAAIEYKHYDRAIIVTGDGDFACLVEYLLDNKKLLKIITPTHKYSQLLQPFYQHIIKAEQIRNAIEYKKSQTRRSVETLGVSGNGDRLNIAKKTTKVNLEPGHMPKKPKENL